MPYTRSSSRTFLMSTLRCSFIHVSAPFASAISAPNAVLLYRDYYAIIKESELEPMKKPMQEAAGGLEMEPVGEPETVLEPAEVPKVSEKPSVVHEPSGLEPARVSCYIQLLVVLNDNGSVY